MRKYFSSLALCIFLLGSHATTSFAGNLAQDRKTFSSAASALKKNHLRSFFSLSQRIKDYPLYPYLRYLYLKKQLKNNTVSSRQINSFLTRYSASYLAKNLRYHWLTALYRKKEWHTFLHAYQPSSAKSMQCRYATALYYTGEKSKSFNLFKNIWKTGQSLPKTCDRLIALAKKNRQITPSLLWSRIELAMLEGNRTLARYLGRSLSWDDRTTLNLWLRIQMRPKLILKKNLLSNKNPITATIVEDTLFRILDKNTKQALSTWKVVKNRYTLSPTQKGLFLRKLALFLAVGKHPDAVRWLKRVPTAFKNDEVRAWEIRTALHKGQWKTVKSLILKLPASERRSEVWQYWLARAYTALGQKTKGTAIYKKLAQSKRLYGFLSKNQLQLPNTIKQKKAPVSQALLTQVASLPAVQRSLEFHRIGYISQSRKEWLQALRLMTPQQKIAAAQLAHQWEWYDLSILAIAQTPIKHDFQLRYPMAYYRDVKQAASKADLSAAYIFSTARQESIFHEKAASPVGALGVMQLRPSTARLVSRELKSRYRYRDLLSADKNIQLGSRYLKNLLNRYNNRLILAAAAYNAGPNRVKEWLPRKKMDADIWLETIPYKETRQYTKNILLNTIIYSNRLGRPIQLDSYLKAVSQNLTKT